MRIPSSAPVASLFAIGIVLGVTGRGQERESLAAAIDPQQAAQTSSATGSPATRDGEPETASLRSETIERLKALGAVPAPDSAVSGGAAGPDPAQPAAGSAGAKADATPRSAPLSAISSDRFVQKPVQKLLKDRLQLLDVHAKLSLALKKAVSPEVSPDQQAEQFKAELTQLQVMLTQAEKNPETLLPAAFRRSSETVPSTVVSEMKDAIDATTHELGEWKSKMEALKSGRADRESKNKARAAERDRIFKLVTSLNARSVEFEKAVTEAQTVEDGRLAQERLVNYQWEVKVESLRLQVIEAEIALGDEATWNRASSRRRSAMSTSSSLNARWRRCGPASRGIRKTGK